MSMVTASSGSSTLANWPAKTIRRQEVSRAVAQSTAEQTRSALEVHEAHGTGIDRQRAALGAFQSGTGQNRVLAARHHHRDLGTQGRQTGFEAIARRRLSGGRGLGLRVHRLEIIRVEETPTQITGQPETECRLAAARNTCEDDDHRPTVKPITTARQIGVPLLHETLQRKRARLQCLRHQIRDLGRTSLTEMRSLRRGGEKRRYVGHRPIVVDGQRRQVDQRDILRGRQSHAPVDPNQRTQEQRCWRPCERPA